MNSVILLILIIVIIATRRTALTTEETVPNQLEKGLIFNTKLEKLDDINGEDGKTRCASAVCLIACPPYSYQFEIFNKEFSISKMSVIQRKLYKISDPIENIVPEICENFFRPTILFNEGTNTYETGYELYFVEGEVNLNYRKYNYHNFKRITEEPEVRNQSVNESPPKKKAFQITENQFLVFYWIPVLSLKFNPLKFQIRAEFTSDITNDYYNLTDVKCFDYDLGEILYRSEAARDVNFFYSEQNIHELFQTILITPEAKWEAVPIEKSSSRSQIAQVVGEIERTHLVPLMFLHTEAGKWATCTFMNTIQVWSSILHGQLKLIDRYLYTVFREWNSKVKIIFGVSGVLKVKVTKSWKLSKDKYKEYDGKPYEISVPKLIYRIIEYTDSGQTYFIVIVIHNDFTSSKEDRICKHTSKEWAIINSDNPTKGISYACLLLPGINHVLGAYDEAQKFSKPLKLNFMNMKMIGKELKYDDETENIEKKLKKLFPSQELPKADKIVDMNSYQEDSSSSEEKPKPQSKQIVEKEMQPKSVTDIGHKSKSEVGLESQSNPKLKNEAQSKHVSEPEAKVKTMPKSESKTEKGYVWRPDGKFWLDFPPRNIRVPIVA